MDWHPVSDVDGFALLAEDHVDRRTPVPERVEQMAHHVCEAWGVFQQFLHERGLLRGLLVALHVGWNLHRPLRARDRQLQHDERPHDVGVVSHLPLKVSILAERQRTLPENLVDGEVVRPLHLDRGDKCLEHGSHSDLVAALGLVRVVGH